MKKTLLSVLVVGAAWAWAASSTDLYINGKKAAHPVLVHQGRNYVCVDDLKAAGAQVTPQANGLSLRFQADTGGSQQIQAVEGGKGEWLFNGIWRVRVSQVTAIQRPFSGDPGTPGWGVDIEIRNGSKKEVSLSQTGVQLPTLALSKGSVLKADEGDWQLICFRPLLPAASVQHQLKFYMPQGQAADSALRLVIPIDVNSGLLRDTGLRYLTQGSPNFRIQLP